MPTVKDCQNKAAVGVVGGLATVGPIRCVRIRIRTVGMEKKRLNATREGGHESDGSVPSEKA